MKAIVTFITPDDEPYAALQEFPQMPRVGEVINIADFDHSWWRVLEVIYTFRQEGHEDGPEIALIVGQVPPLREVIRRKSLIPDN